MLFCSFKNNNCQITNIIINHCSKLSFSLRLLTLFFKLRKTLYAKFISCKVYFAMLYA